MLKPEQQAQVIKQIQAYEMNPVRKSLEIPLGEQMFTLVVEPFVASPDIMNSSVQIVKHLAENPQLIKDKVVVDMGTGSGILGVASALLGAQHVYLADIDQRAVKNAMQNVENLHLRNCTIFQSDLFNAFPTLRADVQIFNHPYFFEDPILGKDWTQMMLGGKKLLGQYFQTAPRYSASDATYLLSWFTLAGNAAADNDPGKQAAAHGYDIKKVIEQTPLNQGIQQDGIFKIYELARS